MKFSIRRVALGVAACGIPACSALSQVRKADDAAHAEMIERVRCEDAEPAQNVPEWNQQNIAPGAAIGPNMQLPALPFPIVLRNNSEAISLARDSWTGTRYCIRIYSYGGHGPTFASMIDGVTTFEVMPVFGSEAIQADPPVKPSEPAPAAKPASPTPTTPDKPAESKPLEDASKDELDRLLTAAEMGDVFKQAVTLMNDASKRLNDKQDSSVQTQRIQEDVVRKLDQLLAALDKQQDQQQQQQQQQQQDKPQNQPQRKQQQQQQGQQQGPSSDPQEGDRPTLKQGTLNPGIESARAAWGALPARVREMLMQGSGDRFSSRYKQMTEEYYKRLAEEAGR